MNTVTLTHTAVFSPMSAVEVTDESWQHVNNNMLKKGNKNNNKA